jgi:hypothetical protein
MVIFCFVDLTFIYLSLLCSPKLDLECVLEVSLASADPVLWLILSLDKLLKVLNLFMEPSKDFSEQLAVITFLRSWSSECDGSILKVI